MVRKKEKFIFWIDKIFKYKLINLKRKNQETFNSDERSAFKDYICK